MHMPVRAEPQEKRDLNIISMKVIVELGSG
jgi:hypothetical protein